MQILPDISGIGGCSTTANWKALRDASAFLVPKPLPSDSSPHPSLKCMKIEPDATLRSNHVESPADERTALYPWYAVDRASSRGGRGNVSESCGPLPELPRVGAGRCSAGAGVCRRQPRRQRHRNKRCLIDTNRHATGLRSGSSARRGKAATRTRL